ncbi:MAG: hypothetical protein UU93_C0008G0016 [Candidatus Amesbacteria bacterium GW2011_GWA2_42_12]|uniref:Uncharacterized protein n=1 Tax=Candidatus Amesbacteria bacterium GW2011_GWA2_42_12 TaxID=1618356 RepID=A0A0G0Y6B3_9BACT|nr:MAG: hypothetical protein UU93_C0008G0016 [Candidatus Amesbacteria bacterium GW2011_GWA2_42_12]
MSTVEFVGCKNRCQNCPLSQRGENKCNPCGVYKFKWLIGVVIAAIQAQRSSSPVDRLRVVAGITATEQLLRQNDAEL